MKRGTRFFIGWAVGLLAFSPGVASAITCSPTFGCYSATAGAFALSLPFQEFNGGPLFTSASSAGLDPNGSSWSAIADLETGTAAVSGTFLDIDISRLEVFAIFGDTLEFHGSGTATFERTLTANLGSSGLISAGARITWQKVAPVLGDVNVVGTGFTLGVVSSKTVTLPLTVADGDIYFVASEVDITGGVGIATSGSIDPPLQLILSPGVTFTSASGKFLSSPASAVPEPASLLLLSSGLAALGGAAWRKRRK